MHKLSDDDGRAVDEILDTPETGESAQGNGAGAVDAQRVAKVEQLLRVLDNMVVAEPPAGLVGRVLRAVEEPSVGEVVAASLDDERCAQVRPFI